MEIDRNSEGLVVISDNGNLIESYSMSKEITFSNLINHLLKQNMREKITCNMRLKEPKPEEENLIKLLTGILDDYNNKVDELNQFVALAQKQK